MPQEPNPVVLKQVKEISCLPVNTRACSSTRHYTTHSYPQRSQGRHGRSPPRSATCEAPGPQPAPASQTGQPAAGASHALQIAATWR